MEIEKKEIYNIVRSSDENIIQTLVLMAKDLSNQNLILDLSNIKTENIDFKPFKNIFSDFQKNNKSLVLVLDTDFNNLPSYIIATPTLQEAHDLVEMDEIERDLGL